MLSVYDISDRVLDKVKSFPGSNAIEIAIAVVRNESDIKVDIPRLLEEMVDDRTLLEVVYYPLGKNTGISKYFLNKISTSH